MENKTVHRERTLIDHGLQEVHLSFTRGDSTKPPYTRISQSVKSRAINLNLLLVVNVNEKMQRATPR